MSAQTKELVEFGNWACFHGKGSLVDQCVAELNALGYEFPEDSELKLRMDLMNYNLAGKDLLVDNKDDDETLATMASCLVDAAPKLKALAPSYDAEKWHNLCRETFYQRGVNILRTEMNVKTKNFKIPATFKLKSYQNEIKKVYSNVSDDFLAAETKKEDIRALSEITVEQKPNIKTAPPYNRDKIFEICSTNSCEVFKDVGMAEMTEFHEKALKIPYIRCSRLTAEEIAGNAGTGGEFSKEITAALGTHATSTDDMPKLLQEVSTLCQSEDVSQTIRDKIQSLAVAVANDRTRRKDPLSTSLAQSSNTSKRRRSFGKKRARDSDDGDEDDADGAMNHQLVATSSGDVVTPKSSKKKKRQSTDGSEEVVKVKGTRVMWTQEEEDALIACWIKVDKRIKGDPELTKLTCKQQERWSTMMKDEEFGAALSGRGPVKLKDKHRQILKEVKRGERTNNPFEYN